MNTEHLQEYWQIIRVKSKNDLDHYLKPLSHLDNFLAFFNLPLLDSDVDAKSIQLEIESIKPTFKNLTDEILLKLRTDLYTQNILDYNRRWAEKLLRYCEVRYHDLKKRTMAKMGDKKAARLHFLHLMVLLLDYAVFTGDPRYLNVVLKLRNQKWAFNEAKIKTELLQEGSTLLAGLFEFRLILLTEYGLRQISKGPTL